MPSLWLIVIVVFLFAALRGDSATYLHVPDGDNWRRIYRRYRDERRRPKLKSWFAIGLLGGLAWFVYQIGEGVITAVDTFLAHQLEPAEQQPALWLAFMVAMGISFASLLFLWLLARRKRPKLTPQEIKQRQTEKEQQARLRQVERKAKQLRPQIIDSLAQMGFQYTYRRQGAVKKSAKPEIRHVLYGQDALYFRFDKLPFRTRFTDLLEPEVVRNLALAIGRECRIYENHDIGVWLIVGLRSGVAAIPRLFDWYDDANAQNALDLLPQKRPFVVALGLGENRRFHYEDGRRFPHLLVAGATGGGKSVFLNQMLCTFITQNAPAHLQMVLIDLKGGLEFWQYRDIPHLRRPVVVEPTEVPDALQEILQEKERRFALFRKQEKRDIRAWNATNQPKLPYIFLFFDEISALMLNPELKKHVEGLVVNLAEQGRALGLHLVLCTQVPNKAVLTTRIKSNITARIAFATDATGSMLTLGNQKARKLKAGSGRAIYASGLEQVEVQAPLITDGQIHEAIQAAIEPQTPISETVMVEELFQLSLDQYDGYFAWRTMWEAMDGNISQHTVKAVAKTYQYSFEEQGPVIELGERGRFILAPPLSSNVGRKLVAVNGRLPQSVEELDP